MSGNLAFSKVKGKLNLTNVEKKWLIENRDRKFILGVDSLSGMDYFHYKGEVKGYLVPLVSIMKKDLGLNIKIKASKSWNEVYLGLQNGSVDILFGANKTPEREKFMVFTSPVYKNPYAIIARKDGNINTIGDLDKKHVGFLKSDFVVDMLPKLYKNINYEKEFYSSQEDGIAAIKNKEIDAFVTSGGPIVYEFLTRFPELAYVFKLNAVNSDMTCSTRKKDYILAGILDKEIKYLHNNKLPNIINQNEVEYNIKIMNLTPKETKWLETKAKAVVGITKDYLPFDYYINGEYKGISGEIIKDISRMTGIKFTYYYGEFDDLYQKLKMGDIDVLNIAKTNERMKYVLYPRAYSLERDIIIGRKSSEDVKDIYGLEGKRVAVIKGFWHYELLMKNLTKVNIIETNDIKESLTLVNNGKADYLIENPTVARYYIEELQLYDLVEKGVTSNDSYLYYGITKKNPELSGIINKVIPLMNIDELIKRGYEEVPHESNKSYLKGLISAIIGMGILLTIIIAFAVKLIKDLVREKTQSELLRQREHFLYTDTLTGLYNRNYFDTKIKKTIDITGYPQTVIVSDMNNLKIANDKYGHNKGDELLKLYADILMENCPRDSMIFRMGGDEFHIILEATSEQETYYLINKLKSVTEIRYIVVAENKRINPAVAFGQATRYSDGENFDELVRIADSDMYNNKNKYKNML